MASNSCTCKWSHQVPRRQGCSSGLHMQFYGLCTWPTLFCPDHGDFDHFPQEFPQAHAFASDTPHTTTTFHYLLGRLSISGMGLRSVLGWSPPQRLGSLGSPGAGLLSRIEVRIPLFPRTLSDNPQSPEYEFLADKQPSMVLCAGARPIWPLATSFWSEETMPR